MTVRVNRSRVTEGKIRSSQSGFTMVELLLGTFLASVISLAVFSMFVTSSDYYGRQLDLTQAQSSLRFASEYLKSELRDIGRLSVMSTDLRVRDPQYCGALQYRGIELKDNDPGGDNYQVNQALIRNNIAPDRLRLLLDVSGGSPLYLRSVNGTSLTLAPTVDQPTIEARRLTGIGAAARFTQLFDDYSLTRITNLSTGLYDVIPTSSAQLVNGVGQITLSNAPCLALACESATCVANPIHWVEYAVLTNETNPERSHLARRRLSLEDGTPLDRGNLIIADYIVDFQVWGQYDTRGQSSINIGERSIGLAPQVPDDEDIKDDRGNWDKSQNEESRLDKWAHRLRGLNIVLAARAARVDPKLTLDLNTEEMGPQERSSLLLERSPETGRAYVSTLMSLIDTPNLYRGD